MVRILLLDDSPTMHRVVKLTFADDPQVEIFAARTRLEADQSLSAHHIDMIIAYARFDGLTDTRYFEGLKLAVPRILVLAEGEENLEHFVEAGFQHFLQKPFHSDELRQLTDRILEERFSADDALLHDEKNFGLHQFKSANSSADKRIPNTQEPPVTLDLSFLQMHLEPMAQNSAPTPPPRRKPPLPSSEPTSRKLPREFSDDEMTISQNLIQPEKVGGAAREFDGMSRKEVESIVEQSVAIAVNRAVRQALNEALPELRQTVVLEVSRRAVEQLSEELMTVKKNLREQMLGEIREMSTQWLKKETPNLAKDVIREEIRRVIEQI